MRTAGVDAGAENTKVVILKENRILSHSIIPQGIEGVLPVVQRAMQEALTMTGIQLNDIENIVATGIGSEYVPFAGSQATESSCCARAGSWLCPSMNTIIDMGANKCLVVKCQNGRPLNTVRNDRCASGTGRFLKVAAKPLGVDVEEMGRLSLQSQREVEISSTCAVFAESEIISLIHLKHRPEDIAKAVFRGLAQRIYTLMLKVGFEQDLMMVGGIASNIGMVKAIEDLARCRVIVPENPILAGALGAALIAAERRPGSMSKKFEVRNR
jgi:predicted CoA-substrate-specific enzyme activase